MPSEHGGAPVSARGLAKSFGAIPILRGIDLDVAGGEVVAVLGPNGAGKSTLLRILAGAMRPSAGWLAICGAECFPARPSPATLSRVGFVGHDPLVYRDLTPRQNLAFFARAHRLDDPAQRAGAALERAGIAAAGNRPTHQLSRGMLQRLALARATLHDPEVLLLDEPFTGLDPDGAAHLEREIADARARGRAVVAITHDFAQAARIATRAVLVTRGRVALDRSPVPPEQELSAAFRPATGGPAHVADRA